MDIKKELLDSVDIMIKQAFKSTAQITFSTVSAVSANSCTIICNGQQYNVKFYGNTPIVNKTYPLFIPQGNMSFAFIIC